jgi:hypothetical protein
VNWGEEVTVVIPEHNSFNYQKVGKKDLFLQQQQQEEVHHHKYFIVLGD